MDQKTSYYSKLVDVVNTRDIKVLLQCIAKTAIVLGIADELSLPKLLPPLYPRAH